MSTHNIGFYEDLTKIIFELSSNIIKYAAYFFCWHFVIINPHNTSAFPHYNLLEEPIAMFMDIRSNLSFMFHFL